MFLEEDDNSVASNETLGGRIVSAREAQELSTAQLARRLGITSSTLKDWETDRDEPRPNRLMMLAGMLNVSPTWLLMGRGESPSDELTRSELERLRSSVQVVREQANGIIEELDRLDTRLASFESYRSD